MADAILVIGSLNIDLSYRVPHLPLPGETLQVTERMRSAGGKGANQAVAAARLGGQVTMIGRLGADSDGDVLLDGLMRAGVDCRGIERDPAEPTGSAMIAVADSGENHIIVHSGANGTLAIDQLDRQDALLHGARICLLQLETPQQTVREAIRRCRAYGVRTFLNPSPVIPLVAEWLSEVDDLVLNRHELVALLNPVLKTVPADPLTAARSLLNGGVGRVWLTLGSEGAVYIDAHEHLHVPALPVQAVDTTAAGDTFLGALVAALAENQDKQAALRQATVAAGLAVTRRGAQASMPDRRELHAHLTES